MILSTIFLILCSLCSANGAVILGKRNKDKECVDKEIWLAGSYACSLLLDETNKYGFYRRRGYMCTQPTTDCCQTCAKIQRMKQMTTPLTTEQSTGKVTLPTTVPLVSNCTDTHVWIADMSIPCHQLLNKSEPHGVYKKRVRICEDDVTRCCHTCKTVLKTEGSNNTETTPPSNTRTIVTSPKHVSMQAALTSETKPPVTNCTDTHVWIADMSIPCNQLLNQSEPYGVYKNRVKICEDDVTRCCHTCKTMLKTEGNNNAESTTLPNNTRKTVTSPKNVPTQAALTSETKSPESDCKDEYGWIGDGSFPCADLLRPGAPNGVYETREQRCSDSVTRCCETCRKVQEMMENGTRASPDGSVTLAHIKTDTTSSPCTDRRIRVNNDWYPCSSLLNPASGQIYRSRDEFCTDHVSVCCITCRMVIKIRGQKSIDRGENEIIKPVVNIYLDSDSKDHVAQPLKSGSSATYDVPSSGNSLNDVISEVPKEAASQEKLRKAINILNQGFRRFTEIMNKLMANFNKQ